MDLCGDFVQAMAEYLGLDDLKATCDFPVECQRLETLLSTADELQSVRQRLSAEMADNSGIIRTLIVRAEDSRDRLSINWNVEDEKALRTNVNMKSQGTMQACIYKTEMKPLL